MVVPVEATVVELGLTIAGDVASFDDAQQATLAEALRTQLGCFERDGCFLEVRASAAASVNVVAIMTIPDAAGGNATAIRRAATTLAAQPTASLSISLGVSVVSTPSVQVSTSVTVPLAVAPPPPSPPLLSPPTHPPPPPSPPPPRSSPHPTAPPPIRPQPVPSPPQRPMASNYTGLHNIKRALHYNTPAATRSAELELQAQAYANTCPTGHALRAARNNAGENLYWAGGSGMGSAAQSYADAVSHWYDEVAHWDFGLSRSSGGATGHFTQIVWRSSVEIGCAVNSNCNNMFSGMRNSAVVCRYAPAGNMMGRESQEVGQLTSSLSLAPPTAPSLNGITIADSSSSALTSSSGGGAASTDADSGVGATSDSVLLAILIAVVIILFILVCVLMRQQRSARLQMAKLQEVARRNSKISVKAALRQSHITVSPSSAAEERLKAMFDEHDANQSGYLDQDEILTLLKALNIISSKGTGDEAIEYEGLLRDYFHEQLDVDVDGRVSFPEFLHFYQAWEASQKGHTRRCAELVDGERFEPWAALAIANFLASVWEDVFEKTEASLVGRGIHKWFTAGIALGHLLVALMLCTLLRVLCQWVPATRTRALTTLAVQITSGWAAKNLVGRVSLAIQYDLVGAHSYCVDWLPPTCFLVCVGVALLVTGLAALTSFLPTDAPPSGFSCRSLRLHLAALVAGATALPLGYAWHVAVNDLLRAATVRTFSGECDAFDEAPSSTPTHRNSSINSTLFAATYSDESLTSENLTLVPPAYAHLRLGALEMWILHSSLELAVAFILAATLGRLKMWLMRLMKRTQAAASGTPTTTTTDVKAKSAASRLRDRMQALVSKTCDFLLAWALFDILTALYMEVNHSPCFPSHGGGLVKKWQALLVATLVILLLGAVRTLNLSRYGATALARAHHVPLYVCTHLTVACVHYVCFAQVRCLGSRELLPWAARPLRLRAAGERVGHRTQHARDHAWMERPWAIHRS